MWSVNFLRLDFKVEKISIFREIHEENIRKIFMIRLFNREIVLVEKSDYSDNVITDMNELGQFLFKLVR